MSGGKVILVGAGPGAPDLLTLRAVAALRNADVVLYDELVDLGVLAHVPARAERVNVGKRGHDAPTRSQDDVNDLLVSHASAGKTVVRLKGGDPFVFGRGGEEASRCAAAGIPFEIVPGVTSALAVPAYAGIPVTDRRHAASFAVVTGHKDPTKVSAETRWEALAQAVDTLVVLMGMRNLPHLVERMLASGRAPETPAAAVMWGTTPQQRVVTATLADLAQRCEEAGLGAPSVVVVGDVVSLRDELGWFERLPLFGQRVLVTRPREQAGDLSDAIRALGGASVEIPTLAIAPLENPSQLDAALDRIDVYDVLLFASANAIRVLAARADELGIALRRPGLHVACVGARTADAARDAGLFVDAVPARQDAEGLAAEVVAQFDPAGRRFLLPRSMIGREILPEALRAAGGEVDTVAVYRSVAPSEGGRDLSDRLEAGALDALTFTSPSTVRNFLAMLRPAALEAARALAAAAIGPTTAEALREAGFDSLVVSERPEPAALVAALAAHLAAGPADRIRSGGEETS